MQFPVSYSTFTIPNGAGPNQSRLVISSDGSLTSYNYDFSPPVFVRMFDGGIYFGTVVAGQADMTHAGVISYSFGGAAGAAIIINSPTTTAFPYLSQLNLVPGNNATNGSATFASTKPGTNFDMFVDGDIHANNISAGTANLNLAANSWAQLPITFANTHTNPPIVIVGGQNGAPAVGGSTQLFFTATSITTTGFTLCAFRSTAITGMSVGWIAIG